MVVDGSAHWEQCGEILCFCGACKDGNIDQQGSLESKTTKGTWDNGIGRRVSAVVSRICCCTS